MMKRVATNTPSEASRHCEEKPILQMAVQTEILQTARSTDTDDATEKQGKQDRFARKNAPWYSRGGMLVNLYGMGMNKLLPVFYLASLIPDAQRRKIFYVIYASSILLSKLGGMKTLFCILIQPTYFCSLLLCFWVLPSVTETDPSYLLLLSLILSTIKVGIPMVRGGLYSLLVQLFSLCLYRAFACIATHHTLPLHADLSRIGS